MNLLLCNHPWEDYRKTLEFIGFASEKERELISKGDKIVYFSSGLVAGIFEAAGHGENAFRGWAESRPFQIRLKPVDVPAVDLVAKPLRYKVQLESPLKGSSSLYRLSAQEFGKIELAIRGKKKELVY
ncbi:MAG TPA: hypothetical protein VJH23_05370 [archaeon]|nr:hypothetical protein [archaeon]